MARKTQPLEGNEPAQNPDPAVSKDENSEEQNDKSLPVLRAELQIAQPLIHQYEAAQAQQHSRERRKFWMDLLALTLGVLGFGVLYWTLVLTQETLESTREAVAAAQVQAAAAVRATEIARKQMEVSGRPWLTITVSLHQPIRLYDFGVQIVVRTTVKNVGLSVATDVWTDVVAMLSTAPNQKRFAQDLIEHRRRLNELREKGRQNADRFMPGQIHLPGEILIPGQEKEFINSMGFTEGQIEEKAFTVQGSRARLISPMLVGCVSYQSTVSDTRLVSGFAYAVYSPGFSYLNVSKTKFTIKARLIRDFLVSGEPDYQ